MKTQIKVEIGQIYKSKYSNMQVVIAGKKHDKWLAKVLTDKPGVFSNTHTLNRLTLNKGYELIQ